MPKQPSITVYNATTPAAFPGPSQRIGLDRRERAVHRTVVGVRERRIRVPGTDADRLGCVLRVVRRDDDRGTPRRCRPTDAEGWAETYLFTDTDVRWAVTRDQLVYINPAV